MSLRLDDQHPLFADALIIDLEDSVAPANKPQARTMAAAFIAAHQNDSPAALFVRINPLDSGMALDDLAAIVQYGLAGIMLPKTLSAECVRIAGLGEVKTWQTQLRLVGQWHALPHGW